MTVLSVENLGKNFGIKPLFDGLTFGLDERDRVGLIGTNGSGKSTLLRIIAGEETADSGRVMLAGNPVVGYLSQNPPFDPDATVLETIFAATSDAMRLLREYEEACALVASTGDEGAMSRVADLAGRLEAIGAWELETNARVVLSRLGITNVTAPMGELSGGERRRVMLAHALIVRPDLLILDEPTNHLDVESIDWLEGYLARYGGALLVVTHDRYFLERVTTRIIELDRGEVRSYPGNYTRYLELKGEEEERREVEEHKRQMLIRQELAWLRRGARARRTKQKARIDRAEELMAAPKREERGKVDFALAGRRLGSKVFELHDVSKSYDGRTLLRDVTYIAQPGERVGIIGPNGSGKTTLLEMIAGDRSPDSGRVEVGDTVAIGYYRQEHPAIDEGKRVIDVIREVAETVTTADGSVITASQMLERFLFPGAMQYATVSRLSGGERRRLHLLRLLMGAPNVLLLDEPTNDLDIDTLVALETYLDAFGGTLVVVSHDRHFLDRTTDHLLTFEGEGVVREFPGTYSAYLEDRREREAEESARRRRERSDEPSTAATSSSNGAPQKLSYKERKELERLERAIEAAEERKGAIEGELATVGTDYEAARRLGEELAALEAKLEADVESWSHLAERG